MKENQKLWLGGAAVVAIAAFVAVRLKMISNFVDQFSYTPTLTGIRIVNSNILNIPPKLGDAVLSVDIRIDNPLTSSHAITDFSIRLFDTTTGTDTQIGNSLPISDKISIPAASSATIKGVQLVIPVTTLFSQINVPTIQSMISTGQLRLNRSYKVKVYLRLDGIAGNSESTIKI